MPKKNIIKKSSLAPTVLIAGGAGFIGSHLAETLLMKEAKVVAIDNFKTGKDSFVTHLLDNPNFVLIDADISAGIPPEIESVDYIFHLAGLEAYIYSTDTVNLDSLLTNALGTKNLLDLANKSKAKFLLASSIDVYQGMISQIDLKDYFGSSSVEEKQYSQTEAKRFAEAMVWEYYKKNDTNVRIVRLPEVFGPRMNFDSCGELGRLLRDLMDNRNLAIYGDGVEKRHYLYINSAVSGLVKALFNEETEGKIYPLVDKETYSQLELVYLLRSIANREVDIVFKPRIAEVAPETRVPDTTNLKDLGWDARITFKEGVIKTLQWAGYEVNENSFKPGKLIEKKYSKTSPVTSQEAEFLSSLADVSAPTTQSVEVQKKFVAPSLPPQFEEKVKRFLPRLDPRIALGANLLLSVFASALIIFVALPIGTLVVNSTSAVTQLKKVPEYIVQFNSDLSKNSANEAYKDFNEAQVALQKLWWLFMVSGRGDLHATLNNLFGSMSSFTKSTYHVSKALVPFSSFWEVLKPDSERILSQDDFAKAQIELNAARTNLQFAQAKYKNINVESLPSAIKDDVVAYGNALTTISDGLDELLSVYSDVPSLLGVDSPKRFLVLFQNSNEIRPTGGFIGSYAEVELNKGKIQALSIDDIYNPDGQILVRNIQTPLPTKLAEFLNEDRLFIRNANWDPDFSVSADAITDLFFKIDGKTYDGVIAVDLHFVESILRTTGPVFLAAYNEEITAQNMYERAQFHSEFNYTEGSSQKKSFLTVLGQKLLERLFTLPSEKLPDLFNEVATAANQKHILVHVTNNPINLLLNKYGIDGALPKVSHDFLAVINSNVGGTKANYFVKNKMKYEVLSRTRDGLLRSELNLVYEHTGKDNAWPGGPYKNYVRVLVPKEAKLTGANLILNEALESDVFEDIEVGELRDYKYFAYTLTVNPTETARLFVRYDLPESLSVTKEQPEYELSWFKQPGTHGDQAEFIFNAPFGMEVLDQSPTSINASMDSNLDFQIKLK